MPINFTVVASFFWGDLHYMRHIMACLMAQIHRDFDLYITMKVKANVEPNMEMIHAAADLAKLPPHRIKWFWDGDDASGGARQMHDGLVNSPKDYIVWLSGDNIVFPEWLLNHARNFEKNPNCISVINTHHLWRSDGYRGILPRQLVYGQVDRLNYALPTKLARDIDAYGEWCEKIPHSDWLTFEYAAKMNKQQIEWVKDQPPCAIHI